jgi:hypothetical protein
MEATGSLQLVQNLLNAKTVEDYTKAQDALTKAIQDQADAVSTINEAGFQTQKQLDDQVTRFKKAYDEMVREGTFTTDQLAEMWKKVEEAQKRAAHDPGQEMADAAAAAGYQTQQELQDAADKAEKLAEYMRDSGKYSAEAVKDAFDKAAEAADRALGINRDAINALQAEYDELNKSVSQEAPEAEMGNIERAQRERMDQIKKEMEQQQAAIEEARKKAQEEDASRVIKNAQTAADTIGSGLTDAITKLPKDWGKDFAKDAFGADFDSRVDTASGYARTQMQTAGAQIEDAFQKAGVGMKDHVVNSTDEAKKHIDDAFNGLSFTVDVHWNVDQLQRPTLGPGEQPEPMAAGGFGRAKSPMTFSTKGDEDFAFSGEGRSFADLFKANQQTPQIGPITFITQLDGKTVKESVIKQLGDAPNSKDVKVIGGLVRAATRTATKR